MKLAVRYALAFLLFFVSLPSFADTLKLVSTGGGAVDGVDVYPYNFSVNGASTRTSLMCLDFNRHVTLGEQWNVSATAIPLDSSTASTDYRADAWIYSMLGKYSNADVQFAAWSIFDPTDVDKLSGFDAAAQSLASQGLTMASNQSLINSGFYSNYKLYLPTSNTTGWTDGTPQDFIGTTGAMAPEPSSLAMLSTGALGVLGAIRRRRLGAAA